MCGRAKLKVHDTAKFLVISYAIFLAETTILLPSLVIGIIVGETQSNPNQPDVLDLLTAKASRSL